jgi:hypothetical protein
MGERPEQEPLLGDYEAICPAVKSANGKNRFEAFNDGLLAIIITSMVLELRLLPPSVPRQRVELCLRRHLP